MEQKAWGMFGRSSETARLSSLLTGAEGGRGRTVAITGEPGVGKSRLIDELTLAGRTCLVLSLAGDRTLQRELEWIRLAPRARVQKSRARIKAYEELVSQQAEQQERELEIYIPPGPRLGDLVIEAKGVSKAYGDRLRSIWKKEDNTNAIGKDEAMHTELTVTGMTCSHCANAVTHALKSVEGVQHAEVNLATGKVTITGDSINGDMLVAAVTELGYKAVLTR